MSLFTHVFRRFFETEKQTPQIFALLECMEESLNKQLKCGSPPHDRMSTSEGAETRSVSNMLRPAGGKQDGMGGSFCGKKSRFQDSAASIMGGKTAQKTEGRVIDNRCRRM